FDNEEVGSQTRQGADSDLFETNLRRIEECLGISHDTLVHQGMMLSCDNGHAVHPNHPEFSDKVNAPVMNGGVVIKSNARQSYTSDGIGIALLKDLMDRKEIPYQFYTNRSDLRGGGTLGNIALHHVSILSVDIGLAQLAMHSPIETAGTKDVDAMIALIRAFYTSHYHNSLQGVSLI
ncbi:MAG: M18 family aminopeptidase, partial [Erysipelotrichaceae bacterium]|nr:M18 family aminopeptidase [Erysipelotrichaceae bacterium]